MKRATTVCFYHVTYPFQIESTLYSCLNVKEFLARNRREIWSLSDSNGTQTHNHLVRKRTLNHLAKLAKWSNVRLRTKWLWVRVPLQSLKWVIFVFSEAFVMLFYAILMTYKFFFALFFYSSMLFIMILKQPKCLMITRMLSECLKCPIKSILK